MLIKVLSGLDPGEDSSVWDREGLLPCSHLGSPSSHLGKSFLHDSPRKVRLLKAGVTTERMESGGTLQPTNSRD